MEKFDIERTDDGDVLAVHRTGPELLRYPLYNKGTAFTPEERRQLGIEGLLPAGHNDIEQQAARIFRSIFHNRDDVGRNIGLAMLQDRNEVLFYKVLSQHLEEVMPIVYTPTVGKASQYYSRVFRRGRGIFITPEYRGRIASVLRDAAPFADVRLMVVTDNEAILGIGDQGAGGMAISVGKLALYCAGAGIHPARTLPISLDVGTDNQQLLDDPLYLGYRHPRLRGAEYVELVDEFVTAAKSVFPEVIIQWEDFRKDNALMILDRYRRQLPSFNDDIQGTGAVACACIKGACRISGAAFEDSRILIYGAGAAGLGIARQLRQSLSEIGVSGDALTRAILVMDSRGIVSDGRERLDEYKRELAWPEGMVAEFGLEGEQRADLAAVAREYQATSLIGASGQGGSFSEDVIRAMADSSPQPVILPMSNPTSISEAAPADVLRCTNEQALIATGSPFDPVETSNGPQPIGQANNVFVFPGIGLGAIACDAREITDAMITAAATALAESLTPDELAERSLVPHVSRLWNVCGDVALAVARQAVDDGVAQITTDLEQHVERRRWKPSYPRIQRIL
ncbi:MAG: NAD-dependent malic enzyme [Woeseiaceae bacterium]|nr:NAD-dependent malic enzyme [Woeseiaceae bacterium]